jgi:hypothetical protein
MRFPATVIPSGNATGVEVPAEVVNALGSGQCRGEEQVRAGTRVGGAS